MRASTVLALTMLLPLAARAERIAALAPIVTDAAPEIVERLHEALVRGLADGGRSAVPAAEVRELVASRSDLAGCRKGPCVRGISEALDSQRVLSTAIEVSGKNYRATIELLGGGTGRVLASRTATCDICTLAEAEAAVQSAALELARTATPWPPPPAPTVIEAKAAPKESPRNPDGDLRRTLYTHRHDLITFGAVIAGTAAAIGGGYLVARHGDCSERDAGGTCTELRNTGAPGAALVGAAVVAFGGAAISTWMGIRSEARRRVYLAPTPTGAVASARVEF